MDGGGARRLNLKRLDFVPHQWTGEEKTTELPDLRCTESVQNATTSVKCLRRADEPATTKLRVYCFHVHLLGFAVFMQGMEKEPQDTS